MDFWHAVLIGVVARLFLWPSNSGSKKEIARLERKLDLLLRHNGLETEWLPHASKRVEFLVGAGKKIDAIKAYREDNPGVGLKEAKDVVDGIARQQHGLTN